MEELALSTLIMTEEVDTKEDYFESGNQNGRNGAEDEDVTFDLKDEKTFV